MMEPMKAIVMAENNLVPVRMIVPDFLPMNKATAKRMFIDIDESRFCQEAWVLDEEWESNQIQSALRMMDWQKVPVLEYDWEALDQWGDIIHDPFDLWLTIADTKLRAKSVEPFILAGDRAEFRAAKYAKLLNKNMWSDWTAEELIRHPCWMFYYAKNVCRGRLPEVLDNAMTMKSFEDSDNEWIKKYFATKKYRKRNKKALSQIPWAA